MKKLLTLSLALSLGMAFGQNKKENDKNNIKEMCGCYEVEFDYAETFSDAKDYEFRDRYTAHALEWVLADEETEDMVMLQHLLVINDSMIIKHWRQDWFYENTELFVYNRNLEWKKEEISADKAKGTWTQKVYQVDDSPRYQGYATWIDVDGKTYWESETFAPLPRREYTTRSDYNVLMRTNRHQITDYGHLHDLDDAKIIRTEAKDSILVWEKGRNKYTKVDDSRCAAAVSWWETNREYWVDVRVVWDDVMEENDYINIAPKADNKVLYERLFRLGDELIAEKKYNSKKAQKQIREQIDIHLSSVATPWDTATAE
ncbi:DUF6607 family protein [Owenweeksia hongkongensis]|uniref:DUF6607 family protein n=1 Tax=Owenweeksia hongkongensis TaxID=253245 RepID=UPI003A8CDEA4